MTIDGERATRDEINSPLCLIGLHHRQVEDDGLALPQRLNGSGHLIKTARFHQVHFRPGSTDARHADHVRSGQVLAEIEGIAVANRGQSTSFSRSRPLIRVHLIVFVDQIIQITIEIVVTSNDGTQTGNERHLETPLRLRLDGSPGDGEHLCPWITFQSTLSKSTHGRS